MNTKLIQLKDGVLVEVDVTENEARQISSVFADRVDTTCERIKPILTNVSRSIIDAWGDINREINIERAEVEIGLSFEGEGNLYITKSKAAANLTLKLVLSSSDNINNIR